MTSRVAPATMLPWKSMWMDSSGTPGDWVSSGSTDCLFVVDGGVLPFVSGTQRTAYTTMTMQALPKTRNVPYVIWSSMIGVSFAMTKLNSHCVIKAAAIVKERTWLG